MLAPRFISVFVFFGLLIAGWLAWRTFASRREIATAPQATVEKQPAIVVTRTFDPNNPPAEMPPLSLGENAECDSNFSSSATVSGETRRSDGSHGTVTIHRVKVKLTLNITTWMPRDATQRVADHEAGHRQISEFYYQGADKLAEEIASSRLGRQIEISGADLDAESNKAILQVGKEITDEYNKRLDPEPTQLVYDSITDHGRSGVIVADAVAHALKNVSMEAPQPSANPGN